MPVIPGSQFETGMGKSTRPYLKNLKQKGLGCVVQMVEHFQGPDSIPTTTKNEKMSFTTISRAFRYHESIFPILPAYVLPWHWVSGGCGFCPRAFTHGIILLLH
jgi:hypothetical protein